MDNNEEKKVQQEQSVVEKKGNKTLVIVLILIILGLVAYIAYDKLVVDKNSEAKTKEVEENNTKEDEGTSPEPEQHIRPTLFNEEVLIEKECPGGTCEKELGTFFLGNDSHTASLSFTGRRGYEGYQSFIIIDDKKIGIENIYLEKFDKIVKIGNDYLAIGMDVGPNTGYEIKIYDENLTLVKEYYSIHVPREIASSEEMYNNFKDYFKVEGNTFTKFSCDTSKDSDGTNQYLIKKLVTINNGNFEEKEVSRAKEYCSAQS